jgi:hypothetical protein
LAFASEALGGEREDRTLTWLLILPIPKPAMYVAKFVAILPYVLALNMGGFALLCLAAGRAGLLALSLFYWPVFWGTLAFAALFHLLAACFRRPALVGIIYCFFLETILGNLPGIMKRVSIGFYVRCMMFDSAERFGVQPEKPSVYLPVAAGPALATLSIATVVLLVAGMVVFSRASYQDLN